MSKTFSNNPLLKTLGEKFKKFMFDRNNVGDNFILPEHFEIDYNLKGKKYTIGIIEAFSKFGVGADEKVITLRYDNEMISPRKFAQKTMQCRKYIDLYIMQNCATKQDLINFCERLDKINDYNRQQIYRETINRVGTPEQKALVEKVTRKDERWNKFGLFILKALAWLFIGGIVFTILYFIGLVIYAIFYDPVGWVYVIDLLLSLFLGGE
jgi:hypothetical protein